MLPFHQQPTVFYGQTLSMKKAFKIFCFHVISRSTVFTNLSAIRVKTKMTKPAEMYAFEQQNQTRDLLTEHKKNTNPLTVFVIRSQRITDSIIIIF